MYHFLSTRIMLFRNHFTSAFAGCRRYKAKAAKIYFQHFERYPTE